MSEPETRSTIPRSMRQKQILEVAEDQPDASLKDIASVIPSVTADHVERVLEEYGDPGDDPADAAPEPSGTTVTSASEANSGSAASATEPNGASVVLADPIPNSDHLTDKQLEILRAIIEHPQAKQCELGMMLGVSRATVSNRVNSIKGFDWDHREEFAEAVLSSEPTQSSKATSDTMQNDVDSKQQSTVAELSDRISALEQDVTELAGSNGSDAVFDDPDLTHRVVHACMKSDGISEDEELQILKTFLR